MLRFFLYRTPVLIPTLYIKTTQSANPQLALIPTSEEGGLRALVWSRPTYTLTLLPHIQ
jgi:hypothetical protein